ncbi:MAG: adenylosuccinate synthase [Deltaproteobacteria bacterium]|nr:adenylosuccinate synthase [Deltaproteobacteria bacterium]
MVAVAIVGAQWGDEGKGKVVDLYAGSADAVVRYAGGPNAGHTIVVGEDRVVLKHVPSGALRAGTICVLAQGMVIDPDALVAEMAALSARGVDLSGRIFVSDRAHLIMPYHVLVDGLREAAAGEARIGTTGRGIGPCYEDKIGRRGLRAGDLRDTTRATQLVARALACWEPTIRRLGGEPPPAAPVVQKLAELGPRLIPLLRSDASALVDGIIRAGKRVLLEGAQGTLLDIDHGTYPFVTSSNTTAGGACTGSGVPPTKISGVVGVSKAYATRVGGGPFPTELFDEEGQMIRDRGHEYGSTTGRPRRCGWFDAPVVRYANRLNGLSGIALTKLDVLTGLPRLKVCVAYEIGGVRRDEVPLSLPEFEEAKPLYEQVEGWKEDISSAKEFGELPKAAQKYVRLLEEVGGVEVSLVSVGPDRNETIVRKNPFRS